MNFLKASVLMTEVASFAIGTVLLSIELSAVLRLVLVIETLLLLIKQVLVSLCHLFNSVSVLTFGSISAEASLCPVLAHFSLVHRPLHKTLLT